MKKVFVTMASAALLVTSVSSCSSTQGISGSALGQEVKTLAIQESEQLIVNYLTQKLAGGHPTLASVLKGANASSTLSSILGGNTANTNLLSSLIASKFGLNQNAVSTAVTRSGSTLGSLASFIRTNSSASTLASVLGL
ncbi:MAG: hypothetical protein GC178_06115 [Flavobacteriales bacterium]|nr:hypothetical protein [Flavobacteriales bacterium]